MNYAKLRMKVFIRMLILIILAIIAVDILYLLVRGRLGEGGVLLLQHVFGYEYSDALSIYESTFRDHWEIIMLIAISAFFLIFFYFSLSWFTKYFNEVNAGMDALIKDEADITLSPEMSSMEQKLIFVKQTLKKRELEVQVAEQNKRDLVMYLAHDIKTPLTSVIGYLSLLNEASDMPKEQQEKYMKITLDKAYHLERLIHDFFEVERYNQQTLQLNKQNVDISYMLIQMPDEFYPSLTTAGKKMVIDAEDTITVYGDADKLARVFNNILKNAVAYSDDNSTIEVAAKAHEGMANITFTNTGQTIPPDKQNSIFDKFYRLDDARSTNTGGAGLGLAIAKEIIMRHEGQIGMQSENGKTVFSVKIPLTSHGGHYE
ncbi:vancomycin resistance histidine kinase VanS [Paenibacillus borealis]|uniref:histidine kinase n=1 Tax=Paenibacillus borealis TaxID=160799 RepID=A0ABX3GUY1_PAEBO|nr:HAMP domain-containing sensor histidine kinase [Paenibacillus borealis]OMD38022.1 vancomycin resistance histidine kinase VanS [Paenibacillus borealis]